MRQVFYYPGTRMFYGVHHNFGYLARFAPRAERVEVLQHIKPSRRGEIFDQFSYVALGPDRQKDLHVTGEAIFRGAVSDLGAIA